MSDLTRSLHYYETILGLQVLRRSAGGAVLAAQASDLALVALHEAPGARGGRRRGQLGLYHYAILLPDGSVLGRFVDHLRLQKVPAGTADHAVSESVYLSDPDGLGIEVYSDRPRSQWRYKGAELQMSTETLDVPGVVAAGGGEPWTGMPTGTIIGHLHLSVGSLELAAAFYHMALGFDQTVWSYPGALFLSAGGYHHHLAVNAWSADAREPQEADARLLEWELIVPEEGEVEQAAESLRSAGYDVRSVGGECVATDPWGTALRLRPAG